MLNKETVSKLYKRVDNILANLAYQDWWNTNHHTNGKRKSKKHIPYSLSAETEEALEILKLINDNMNKEIEETVKGFIMRWRLLKPEYIDSRP